MDAAQTSRQIRLAFAAMLVLGLTLLFFKAGTWQAADGAGLLESDFEMLAYLSWAQAAVNIIGWAVVLLGVHALSGRNDGGGPLTVVLWCWGIALVLDFVWIGVPMAVTAVELSTLIPWFARIDTALVAVVRTECRGRTRVGVENAIRCGSSMRTDIPVVLPRSFSDLVCSPRGSCPPSAGWASGCSESASRTCSIVWLDCSATKLDWPASSMFKLRRLNPWRATPSRPS